MTFEAQIPVQGSGLWFREISLTLIFSHFCHLSRSTWRRRLYILMSQYLCKPDCFLAPFMPQWTRLPRSPLIIEAPFVILFKLLREPHKENKVKGYWRTMAFGPKVHAIWHSCGISRRRVQRQLSNSKLRWPGAWELGLQRRNGGLGLDVKLVLQLQKCRLGRRGTNRNKLKHISCFPT